MKADRFLEMYKEIEELLSLQYSNERRYTSSVMAYINDKSNPYYREELNTCREIRNLLSHHADINGSAIVEPSDEIMALMENILSYIRKPPLALEFATPFDKVMIAAPDQKIASVMQSMKGRGFSHVPVMSGSTFVGMFSVSTPFDYALRFGKGLKPDEPIRNCGNLLQIENHSMERYMFAPSDLSARKAGKYFENFGSSKKRLAMILITKNGKAGEQVLGVLTPFDILHINENE